MDQMDKIDKYKKGDSIIIYEPNGFSSIEGEFIKDIGGGMADVRMFDTDGKPHTVSVKYSDIDYIGESMDKVEKMIEDRMDKVVEVEGHDLPDDVPGKVDYVKDLIERALAKISTAVRSGDKTLATDEIEVIELLVRPLKKYIVDMK